MAIDDEILSTPEDDTEAPPLVLVRYGLAKEIQLFADSLVFVAREEGEADRFMLDTIRTLLIQPGDKVPSKLLVLLELADGQTIIVGEGMTNVAAFSELLAVLGEVAPQIKLDPPDMADKLRQAVTNRRQSNLGCYGAVLGATLLIVLVCVIGNIITHFH